MIGPTNSNKVLKEKLASHCTEEAQNPPGASHRVTSEPLNKEKPYHSGYEPSKMAEHAILDFRQNGDSFLWVSLYADRLVCEYTWYTHHRKSLYLLLACQESLL